MPVQQQTGIFGDCTYNACVVVELSDSGNITYLIQAMLSCKGYDLSVDGIFGNNTDSKVKDFQSKNGLVADGKVGKNTFKKLFKQKIELDLFQLLKYLHSASLRAFTASSRVSKYPRLISFLLNCILTLYLSLTLVIPCVTC